MKKSEIQMMKCDETEVPVEIRRCEGNVMKLKVSQEGNIILSAPEHVSRQVMEQFMNEKKDWIKRQMDFFRRRQAHLADGSDGRSAVLQGKRYSVKTVISKKPYLEKRDDVLIYHVKKDCAEDRRKLFEQETRKTLTKLISEERKRLDEQICGKYGTAMPVIGLRRMTGRWGSCYPKKSEIVLSKLLIHVPKECFVYVLLHEYVHLVVQNHSERFYEILSSIMPEYRKAEIMLREYIF